jgi:SagB-type dehydrogenase family enzyme
MNPVGDNFQKETRYHKDKMSGKPLDWASQPNIYKNYPDCQTIQLPDISPLADTTLHEVLKKRKSIRKYQNKPIKKEILSYLLWASTGISRTEGGYEFRTAPSAGALYPIETYLVVNNVEEIKPGVYHYNIQNHYLELLKEGGYAAQTVQAALGQKMCADAPVVFIWTAIFQRMKWKYDQRAYRYIYLDAGHIAENLALAATSLELGSCQIGALYDDEVNQIIDVDGTEESVIYMSVVG